MKQLLKNLYHICAIPGLLALHYYTNANWILYCIGVIYVITIVFISIGLFVAVITDYTFPVTKTSIFISIWITVVSLVYFMYSSSFVLASMLVLITIISTMFLLIVKENSKKVKC